MLRRTRGDVETILGSYAPDAVVLPPNSPAVQGLVAIRQLWEALLAAGYRNAGFELDEIEHWGEVALAIGRYKVQVPTKSGTLEEDAASTWAIGAGCHTDAFV